MGFFALHDFTERKYVNGVRCCCVYACKLMSDIDSSHTIIGTFLCERDKNTIVKFSVAFIGPPN